MFRRKGVKICNPQIVTTGNRGFVEYSIHSAKGPFIPSKGFAEGNSQQISDGKENFLANKLFAESQRVGLSANVFRELKTALGKAKMHGT
jgi:hypothetical protein